MILNLDAVNSDELIEERIKSNNDLVSLLDVEDNYLVSISPKIENNLKQKVNILEDIHLRQQQIIKNNVDNRNPNQYIDDKPIEQVIYDVPNNINQQSNYVMGDYTYLTEESGKLVTKIDDAPIIVQNQAKQIINDERNSIEENTINEHYIDDVKTSSNLVNNEYVIKNVPTKCKINAIIDELEQIIKDFDNQVNFDYLNSDEYIEPVEKVDLRKLDVMHDNYNILNDFDLLMQEIEKY